MRASKKFRIKSGRYYFDYNEDARTPGVVIFADSGGIVRAGIGFEREDIAVRVWFVHKNVRKTQTKELYEYVELLRALLHTQKRLGGLAEVQYAKLVGYRQIFGSRANYLIDVMEVSIDVKLLKTY